MEFLITHFIIPCSIISQIVFLPCNQFENEEPGSNAEVKAFAIEHGAKYDLFSKVDVNGSDASPLFKFLKTKLTGELTNDIKWNFTKFLCTKDGVPYKRYAPTTEPLSMESDIKVLLEQ